MTIQLSITEANQKRVELINERERTYINQPSDIADIVYHTINGYVPANVRHLTVDELPKIRIDKRNGYPDWYKKPSTRKPGKLNPKTRAKRAAALVQSFYTEYWDSIKREWIHTGGDRITHTATGRVWDITTGATPEEFMEVLS